MDAVKWLMGSAFSAVLMIAQTTNTQINNVDRMQRVSPTCSTVTLTSEFTNNAPAIVDKLNGITEGVTVRALGRRTVVICGDDTNRAVTTIAQAAEGMGKETVSEMAPRESLTVQLFFNRDAKSITDILSKAFPKLGAYASGTDLIVLGSPDGSDASSVQSAKRWIAALDLPRPQIDLNIWSVQISGKKDDAVAEAGTAVRKVVGQHNRELEVALERAHVKLSDLQKAKGADFFAKRFSEYLSKQYVVPENASSEPIVAKIEGICEKFHYCLGFRGIFEPNPTISSLLINVVAAQNPGEIAMTLINSLENDTSKNFSLVDTGGYSATSVTLAARYGVGAGAVGCEDVARMKYEHHEEPVFPCLREALSDQTQSLPLGLFRAAIADFLMHYKMTRLYPTDVDTSNLSVNRMDSLAGPLLSAFNRDLASYLRHVRDDIQKEVEDRSAESMSNGIVSLSTISSIPSSVGAVTQSAFPIRNTWQLKDLLAGSIPGKDDTVEQKIPKFLSENLAPGVALPLLAALSLDTTPAFASVGKGLTMAVTPQSLPGGSSAELNINLISQDEGPPTVQKGSANATLDPISRVAKHNLQTVVRVKSMRLFELSSFSSQVVRGQASIPLFPIPFVETPVLSQIFRYQGKPVSRFHRSFLVVSAVVLPTSADLASTVTPFPDLIVRSVALEPTAVASPAPAGATPLEYYIIAKRQAGDVLRSPALRVADPGLPAASPAPTALVNLSWNDLGDDVFYDVYRVSGTSAFRIASNLRRTHFEDRGGPAPVATLPPAGPDLASASAISPASFLPGTVQKFHSLMRRCIIDEAASPAAAPPLSCANLSLKNQIGSR